MLDPERIRSVVDLQQRSYKLLRWATDAVDRGFITFDRLHRYATLPEATLGWLESHYSDVPLNARPDRDQLRPFSNLFSTYLENSFDLIEQPGQRLFSPEAHCFCPMCSWLVAAPRLQTKKVSRQNKARARKLQQIAIKQVAVDHAHPIIDESIEALANDPALRETLALVAYGYDLLRRVDGVAEGPATLALWRGFAWTTHGSPNPDFELTAQAILDAQAKLGRAVLAT